MYVHIPYYHHGIIKGEEKTPRLCVLYSIRTEQINFRFFSFCENGLGALKATNQNGAGPVLRQVTLAISWLTG